MSSSQEKFIELASALRAAVAHPALMDAVIGPSKLKPEPGLLRNGLCVVGFVMLEDFMKSRVAELTKKVPNGKIPFGSLPEELRNFYTIEALEGLRSQAKLYRQNKWNYVSLIQDHAAKIGSIDGLPYQLSEFGFGANRSNIDDAQVAHLLACYKARDGWKKMDQLLVRLGVSGTISCRDAFATAMRRRHTAAHTSTSAATVTELSDYVSNAIAIALVFDILLSRAAQLLADGDTNFCKQTFQVEPADIPVRYIEERGSHQWASVVLGKKRASRVSASLVGLRKQSEATAKKKREALVLFDRSRRPISWSIPALD